MRPAAPASASSTSSFMAKFLVEGPMLQRFSTESARAPVAGQPGRIVYTQWLNETGGEADLS